MFFYFFHVNMTQKIGWMDQWVLLSLAGMPLYTPNSSKMISQFLKVVFFRTAIIKKQHSCFLQEFDPATS